ncbi:helix-turn-helix domain-containing protein [Microbacterium sp. bgisy207]|jgi:Zn-dependent peptidase ImmA (M78 family)/DNA-binding XRE family transcriptional regulator|uniref:helix-turn-helix domain-containing protein n=1 Tax=Microbacterium sp. bgisy207 TaxID=3413800 RepID=UPI003EB6E0DB
MVASAEVDLGNRIRDLRKRASLSQEDLATAVRLDRTVVNKIESGVRKVTALELSEIAVALGVRMTSFFEDPTPALVSHRSSQGLDTVDSKIDALLAAAAGDVEFLQQLGVPELAFDAVAEIESASIGHPQTNSEADDLAARARKLMGLDDEGPIKVLTAAVERLGLLAFTRDIGSDTADAGTVILRHGGVCLVNSHTKVGRRRLALAHELGHYLVADDYTVDWRIDNHSAQSVPLESRLDRFARALLLPAAPTVALWRKYLQHVDERAAAVRIASAYRVDMATLSRRLRELGEVDSEVSTLIRLARTTQADILEFDLHLPLEELASTSVPRAFALAVLRLVRDERISRERALDLLRGTFEESDLPAVRERRADEIWNFVA